MVKPNLDFLVIAPTPFYANRGCHMRIRGEAEALRKKGRKILITTYKEGENVPEIKVIRSPFGVGSFGQGVAATWKNIPAGFFLFWSVLYETIYRRPTVLYGHLFEGVAIGIAVKYLAIPLSLFNYNPILVLDAQDSLAEKMASYRMIKKNSSLFNFFRWLERFILFFPDFIFASSVQGVRSLKEIRPRSNPLSLPDGISIFQKGITSVKIKKFGGSDGKSQALSRISSYFSLPQVSLIEKWIKDKNTVLLYTGSYSPAKGFPAFIEQCLPSLLKNKNLRFLFGGGDYTGIANLDKLIKANPDKIISLVDLNLKNLVFFSILGDIAIDCKPPQTSESSGKILNYMAVGLPIVCFDQENNKFFLAENGLYAKNYSALSKNILTLANDLARRAELGKANSERAWNKFTWDKTVEKMLECLARDPRLKNQK